VNDKSAERVLVIPTSVLHDAGIFQGFTRQVVPYLSRLLAPAHLSYRSRAEAEDDPRYKQLIPYVILRWRDQVFHYLRGKRATETRLHALRSIGVGGHINAADGNLFEDQYRDAMLREVAEEVYVDTAFEEHCIGLINDDSTPVGKVHLGIVHVFDLQEPNVRRREQALTQAGFAPIAQLLAQKEEFETWSRFALEAMVE